MVEFPHSLYDQEVIPLVHASIVAIDEELEPEVTAQVVEADAGGDYIEYARSASSPPPYIEASSVPDDSTSSTDESTGSSSSSVSQDAEFERNRQRRVASGVAGAVLGLFVGGPVVSLVFGFGSAHCCQQEGAMGDVARALGDVALVTRDKMIEVDAKHHLVDKGRVAATTAFRKMQEAHNREQERRRRQGLFVTLGRFTWDFVQRHQLIQRGARNVKQLLDLLIEKLPEYQSRVTSGSS